MSDGAINLLEELDSLSKIHTLKRDDIDNLMVEFAKRILPALRLERMSVWLFNPDKTAIVSIGEYDLPKRLFQKENTLLKSSHPSYFKAISENELLMVENVYTSRHTKELVTDYLQPAQIISLMDIPMRMEGELIGVMCFEKTGGVERVFTHSERTFALSVSIVFASNLEARHRRTVQHKLTQELKEKATLLKEIHHRVKNNLAVVSGLMGLQSEKARDTFHKGLFDECRNKINSILVIHDMIYRSKSFTEIGTLDYFTHLLESLGVFYTTDTFHAELDLHIEDFVLELQTALPLALITNEVVVNCYKHAFNDGPGGVISFHLSLQENTVVLAISDNGQGFKSKNQHSESLGFEIIKGLAEQLDGTYSYTGTEGTRFILSFVLKNTAQEE